MDSRLEDRYIVIKRSDVPFTKQLMFYALLQDYNVPTRDCVVVESDWGIYPEVVDMVLKQSKEK